MQSLTLGMSYTGAGKIYWTEKNNVSQSFYGTLNGRISLQTEALQIDVWGRNLTNKDYTTFYFETMHRGFEQKADLYNWGWIYVITSNHSCKNKKGVLRRTSLSVSTFTKSNLFSVTLRKVRTLLLLQMKRIAPKTNLFV